MHPANEIYATECFCNTSMHGTLFAAVNFVTRQCDFLKLHLVISRFLFLVKGSNVGEMGRMEEWEKRQKWFWLVGFCELPGRW